MKRHLINKQRRLRRGIEAAKVAASMAHPVIARSIGARNSKHRNIVMASTHRRSSIGVNISSGSKQAIIIVIWRRSERRGSASAA